MTRTRLPASALGGCARRALLLLATLVVSLPATAAPQPGESLTFDVSWQSAPAGTLVLRTRQPVTRQKRKAYPISGEAQSNAVVDQVYRVHDRFTSWTDAETLTTLGYSEQTEEGPRRRTRTVLVDPAAGRFSSRDASPAKAKAAAVAGAVPARVQDILSALAYVRAQPLAAGARVPLAVLHDETVRTFTVAVVGQENLETAAGVRACVKTQLVPAPKAGEDAPALTIFVWFTADARHIPMKVTVDLPTGPVTAELSDYKAG